MLLTPLGGNGCPLAYPTDTLSSARVTQDGYEHGQYGITLEGRADRGYDCFLDAAICITNSILGNMRPSLPP